MEMKLAENIRAFRKQHLLTQEQLAEVLGVTVGAVYKWEAKLSQPELTLIVAMADFFDTSVDVLLGYEMKDNRLQATVDRLKQFYHDKDPEGIPEAEKALKKYPNAFDVVYSSATLFRLLGLELPNKALLHRALELLEQARLLLAQNTDPKISELTIYGRMAEVYHSMEEDERAIVLWQTHNAAGIYNDLIGLTLASSCERPDEALPYLSEALLDHVASFIHVVIGYVNVYYLKRDFASAQAILRWGLDTLSGLRDGSRPSFLDKVSCVFQVCLAYAQIESGESDAARSALICARALAARFDAAPEYDSGSIRFVIPDKRASVYDDLGATAMQSIENTLRSIACDRLSGLWSEVNEHEE